MIKNEKQYGITMTALAKLQAGLDQLCRESNRPDGIFKLEKSSFDRKISDLQGELEEYDTLVSGKTPVMEILGTDDLPDALIKARIALGLSQKELAQKAGLEERQVQLYEHTDYEPAGQSHIGGIFDALQSEGTGPDIPGSGCDLRHLFERLAGIGLDRDFVMARFVPEYAMDEKNIPDRLLCLQAASRVGRVFGWSPGMVMGGGPLVIESVRSGFGIPEKHNRPELGAHAGYARYIAGLLSGTTRNLDEKAVPESPDVIRDAVADSSRDITFRGMLDYVWSMGVPVIAVGPLSFHAATMRNGGKSTIFLARRAGSEARWISDVLRGLYRVIKGTEGIEVRDVSYSLQGGERPGGGGFARAVLLGDPEGLYRSCLGSGGAGADLAHLEGTVAVVAERNGVRAGALADHVACRLWQEASVDWRGPAQKLQGPACDMRAAVSDAVLANAELDLLSRPDQELMLKVLRAGDES